MTGTPPGLTCLETGGGMWYHIDVFRKGQIKEL